MTTTTSNSSDTRRLFSSAAKLFVGSFVSLPTGIITAAILSRSLGPNLYGSFAVATGIIVWIELVVSQVFTRPTIKFVAETDEWESVAGQQAWGQFLVSLSVTAIVFLSAPMLESTLNSPNLGTYLRLFSLEIPLHALSTHQGATLVGRSMSGRRGFAAAARWITRMMFIFVLVSVLGWSIEGAILANIASTAVEAVIARWAIRHAPLFRFKFSGMHFGGYFVPLTLNAIGLELFRRFDLMIVEAYHPNGADSGYYGAAQALTFSITLIGMAITPSLLASISRLLQQDKADDAKTLVSLVYRLMICMLPFVFIIIGARFEIIRLIYGDDFLPAGAILAALALSSLGIVVLGQSIATLIADGKPNWVFAINLPLAPLALIALFILVPIGGTLVAAITTASLAWTSAIVMMIAVHRNWEMAFPAKTLIRTAILCIISYSLTSLLVVEGLLLIPMLAIVAFAILIAYGLLGEYRLGDVRRSLNFSRFGTAFARTSQP
jgi:PST family polysaccharide transporter